MLCSAVLQIIVNLTGVKTANPLLYQVLYTFIVIAFAERKKQEEYMEPLPAEEKADM